MAHSSLDADASIRGAPGVGVQDVHKLSIVFGQGVLVVCMLEGWTSGIQTWKKQRIWQRFHPWKILCK